MAKIAIYNFKTGAGQSTLAANLGWSFAAIGKHNTCVWDMNQASGAGALLSTDGNNSVQQMLGRPTGHASLDCFRESENNHRRSGALSWLTGQSEEAWRVQKLAKQYARVIVDCPKVLTKAGAQMVRACDLVIVPITPSPMARRTLERAARKVQGSAKGHPPMLPVFSQFDTHSKLHRAIAEANPTWPIIPYADEIREGAKTGRLACAFAPRAPAARAYAQLWRGIEDKLAGN